MKKLLVLLSLLMLVASVTATETGGTEIYSSYYSNGGFSEVREITQVGGLDWSEGAETNDPSDYVYPPVPRYTSYVDFSLRHEEGTFSADTYIDQPNPWEMVKIEEVAGEGHTQLFKTLTAWTEDKKEVDGYLIYPTEAWVHTEFTTPTPFVEIKDVHFVLNKPEARDDVYGIAGNIAVFSETISTSDQFNFLGKEGVNLYPCTYTIPEPPMPPEPHTPPMVE